MHIYTNCIVISTISSTWYHFPMVWKSVSECSEFHLAFLIAIDVENGNNFSKTMANVKRLLMTLFSGITNQCCIHLCIYVVKKRLLRITRNMKTLQSNYFFFHLVPNSCIFNKCFTFALICCCCCLTWLVSTFH